MNTVPDHPTFTALIDWVDDLLSTERSVEVGAQVANADATTQESVQWMRDFKATAAQAPLFEPPAVLTQRLHRSFDLWRDGPVIEREPVVSQLFFDNRRELLHENVRGVQEDTAVQLAYTYDEGDVVLDFTPQLNGRWALTGQVLSDDEGSASAFEVTVYGSSETLRSVDGTPAGEFAVADVPADATRVVLDNGQVRIAADIQLQHGP